MWNAEFFQFFVLRNFAKVLPQGSDPEEESRRFRSATKLWRKSAQDIDSKKIVTSRSNLILWTCEDKTNEEWMYFLQGATLHLSKKCKHESDVIWEWDWVNQCIHVAGRPMSAWRSREKKGREKGCPAGLGIRVGLSCLDERCLREGENTSSINGSFVWTSRWFRSVR
jgi:hypothetical protein